MEEDTPKCAVSYTGQGGETARGKLRVGRERDLVHGTVSCKGLVIIISRIIIIIFGFAEVRTNSPRYFVTHTEQSY